MKPNYRYDITYSHTEERLTPLRESDAWQEFASTHPGAAFELVRNSKTKREVLLIHVGSMVIQHTVVDRVLTGNARLFANLKRAIVTFRTTYPPVPTVVQIDLFGEAW